MRKRYIEKNKEISDSYGSKSTKNLMRLADEVQDLGNNITLDNYLKK